VLLWALHDRLFPPQTSFLTLFLIVSAQPQVQKKAKEEGFQYAVAKTSFKANSKALAENEGDGMAKVGLPAGVGCSTYRASFNVYLVGSLEVSGDERSEGVTISWLSQLPIARLSWSHMLSTASFQKLGKLVKPSLARASRVCFLRLACLAF
jgi:hypothetical protein